MLFSKEYISKALNRQWYAGIAYWLQTPMFLILSIPCRLPILNELCETISRIWSVGNTGFLLRAIYWKTNLAAVGRDVFIDCGVTIVSPKNVYIGHDVYLDEKVTIRTTGGRLVIGNYVRIAANTYLQSGGGIVFRAYSATSSSCAIYSQTHHYLKDNEAAVQSSMAPGEKQSLIKKRIIIGEGALIGARAVLLPGATVGQYSTIGARSMLNTNVPDYCVAAGCPAKIIRKITRKKQL